MNLERVADVAIDPRAGGAEALYTYKVEIPLEPGDAVLVPLGNRSEMGFVTSVYEATEEDLGFPFASLKPIQSQIQDLSLPPVAIALARSVAEETLCSLPVALSASIPPGIRDRIQIAWTLCEPDTADAPKLTPTLLGLEPEQATGKRGEAGTLSPLQQEVLRSLKDAGGVLIEAKTKKLPASFQRALRLLRGKHLVDRTLRLVPLKEKRQVEPMIRLTTDTERVEAFLKKEGRRRPAQALTVMRMQAAERGHLTASEIKAMAAVTDVTIRSLIETRLLEYVEENDLREVRLHTPNAAQAVAIDAVAESVRRNEFQPFLLYGITGSGKTEIYLRAASEALRQGHQVLFLVPEIALATQVLGQLRDRFGRGVALLHSELPATERLQNWLRIRSGEASVILGARSALFAPMSNLGLVIVDEEHEAAYKQESAPRYHAKRVALELGRLHQCPVLLGSATPSIESFYEAELNERSGSKDQSGIAPMTLLTLPERAASAKLPSVVIEDLTAGFRTGKPSLLCEDLQQRIEATLSRGEQVILFLNRRAYAPFVICRDCGHQMMCPNCAISLSYHRRDQRLRCHHCGFWMQAPETCPKCQGSRLDAFGVGTEKVEETVKTTFPDAVVARLDRDVARKKGALEETLALFRSGEIQILVGTQMVAKGLDFPNVTLVGVIAADVSLNIPDFRSSERTFQLLSQVAGRAGRGTAPGWVVVQTFNPLNTAVMAAQTHDFLTFFESLKVERQEAGYPPFTRLVNIVLSGESRPAVLQAGEDAKALLETHLEIRGGVTEALRPGADRRKGFDEYAVPVKDRGKPILLGPVDCAVERLQNRWRRHLLLKLPPGYPPAKVGEALLAFNPKTVQVVIDVDPYSLM